MVVQQANTPILHKSIHVYQQGTTGFDKRFVSYLNIPPSDVALVGSVAAARTGQDVGDVCKREHCTKTQHHARIQMSYLIGARTYETRIALGSRVIDFMANKTCASCLMLRFGAQTRASLATLILRNTRGLNSSALLLSS